MATRSTPAATRLTDFLRGRRDQILQRWEAGVRALPTARELSAPALIDHVPDLLDRLSELGDEQATTAGAANIGHHHALIRLQEGFDLVEVVAEYGVLRGCILGMWEQEQVGSAHIGELRVLDRAIDTAVAEAVQSYMTMRDRVLMAVDRLVTAAFQSTSLDDLLRRLLRVLTETTPSIASAAILLREGDRLRMRAAVGLDEALEAGFSLAIGEGFAGSIAATARPLALRDAADSPLLVNATLRAKKVRALYGVPLIENGEVIGVAHMGSLTAPDFSVPDKQLLTAVAARATAAIAQHMLRDALAERELQLQSLADNIPQLAWSGDPAGAVTWVNQRWLEFSGWPLEELLGAGWQRLVHPDHLQRVLDKIGHAILSRQVFEDTYAMRSRDGRYHWFLSRAIPIFGETMGAVRWFGTSTDITLHRFLDEATRLLSASLGVNEALDRLAELAIGELADLCAIDLIDADGSVHRVAVRHRGDQEQLAAAGIARLRPYEPGRIEVVFDTASDAARDPERLALVQQLGITSYIVVPLRARERTLGAVTLALTSASGRQYSQAELEVAEELGRRAGMAVDNASLYEQAQSAVKLREDVLAIVSHDLRNPLGAIDLAASLLLQRQDEDGRARRQLEIIRRSASRMEHLIRDLLDMASIQGGRLALDRQPHDAAAIATETVELHAPLAIERGIELGTELALEGVTLVCDRERISQVFGNLVGNSIKFCRPGERITLSGHATPDHVVFTVSDTGPGIPEADLPHVFEPYWSARRHRKQGTGLGLYICRGIVEAHGGTIAVTSTPGHGATFIVTLPRH